MAGYRDILKYKDLEKECDEYGFMMCNPRHYYNSLEYGSLVALKPKDSESLPIYARDTELFAGTLEQLEVWLSGVEWARRYDCMLEVSDDKKRKRKEQDERNRQLVSILAQENIDK